MKPVIVAPGYDTLDQVLWNWAPPGLLAFDVGAHTGESLQRMAGRYERIIALEPAIEAFAALASAWRLEPGITLLPKAAADHIGTVSLSVRSFPIASAMLTAPGAEVGASERLAGWWTDEKERREVPCTTLDALTADYGAPVFVKVDTEGGEELVLAGAQGLLAAGTVSWLIEFHSPRLRQACLDVLGGYEVTWVRNPPEAADYDDDTERDETGWLLAVPCSA